MANVAVTNTFSAGTTIASAQVNTNFTDLTTWLNNRNGGTDTWSNVKVSATAANPMECKSSAASAEFDIDCTGSNGTPLLTLRRSGTTYFTIGVDGAASNLFKIGTTSLTTNVAMQIPTVGAQVQFNDGTVALPGIAFLSDPDTGMFRTSNNAIKLSTGGTLALTIASTQQVLFADGSAAAPTMTWSSGALVTGFYYIVGAGIGIGVSGGEILRVTSSALMPNGTGVISTGDGSNYWNDISYKTLTDRGCLGWFDEGVELPDGSKVSDTAALLAISKDEKKSTIYGVPMLDYKTFPKVAYRQAESNGKLLPRDQNDEPIGGSDGVEMTSMFSIMIGAIKELTLRVAALETQNG